MVPQMGCAVISNSARDAVRLCQVCQTLRVKFEGLKALAEARRLRWLPNMSAEHLISQDGRSLTCTRSPGSDDILPWVTGGLLPVQGRSAWTIRVLCATNTSLPPASISRSASHLNPLTFFLHARQVVRSLRNDGNGMWIGVCDATARCAWGLFLHSGRLRCVCRDAHGKIDFEASPIPGFPKVNYRQVIPRSKGGSTTGALVEVLLDHDAGTLSYCINGGPRLVALSPLDENSHASTTRSPPPVFPSGAALRPYAACYYPGDCMHFETVCV